MERCISLLVSESGALVALTLLVVVTPRVDAEAVQSVGHLYDPARIVFAGNQAFTGEQLRKGLVHDFDFLLASHPRAPRTEYLPALRLKLIEGYQHAGFPDVKVTCALGDKAAKVNVQIVEGPRYLAGAVKVEGGKRIPVEQLVSRLTTPRLPPTAGDIVFDQKGERVVVPQDEDKTEEPKPRDPVWSSGDPAPFDQTSLKNLAGEVRTVAGELGFFFPKLDVSVIRDNEAKIASLLVKIEQEGPPGVLGDIEVLGAKRNSTEDIVGLLRLRPGAAFDQGTLTHVEKRLWYSGRFLSYQVTPIEPEVAGDKVGLRIEVKEYDPAPPLSQDLTEVEKALLRARDWLLKQQDAGEDLVVSLSKLEEWIPGVASIRFTVSPVGGVAMAVQEKSPEGEEGPLHDVIAGTDFLGVFSHQGRRCLHSASGRWRVRGFLSLMPLSDPEKPDVTTSFGLGFGANNLKPGDEQGVFQLDLRLAPAAFIGVVHKRGQQATITDGVVQISGKSGTIRTDAETGALLDCRLSLESQDDVRLWFEEGAFEREVKRLRSAGEAWPNGFDPDAPISSVAEFFLSELLRNEAFLKAVKAPPELDEKASKALSKLLLQNVFRALDRLAGENREAPDAASFEIPTPKVDLRGRPPTDLIANLTRGVVPYLGDLFPPGSWPWTLVREAGFVLTGKAKYTMAELGRIYQAPQTGPIGHLATAKLVGYMQRHVAQTFAKRGLERLAATDFRQDYRLLLVGDTIPAQCTMEVAKALRQLEPEEIEALARLAFPDASDETLKYLKLLCEDQERPTQLVLASILDRYWNEVLRNRVEGALREIATPAAPAPKGAD